MSKEGFPQKESKFETARKAKEAEGWRFVGHEQLTQTVFSKEAKFEEVQHQTEDEIKTRYLEGARREDPSGDFDVDLMLDENTDKLRRLRDVLTDEEYRDILEHLNPEGRRYLVWLRKIEQ